MPGPLTVKGPGIFLSQFIATQPPFNSLAGLAEWAAGLGYRALQIPCHQPAIFDLDQAAVSQTYCDDVRGTLAGFGLEISELSTHSQHSRRKIIKSEIVCGVHGNQLPFQMR